MKQRISYFLLALLLLSVNNIAISQVTVFSNTVVEGCNAWNTNNDWATSLKKTLAVSGLPASGLSATGTVLREVRVRLGNSTCRGNLSSYRLRLTNPQGVQVEIANGLVSTISSIWVDMKFRDDISLERLKEYPSSSVQASYYPHSIGFYALETDGSFANFNTSADPNGDWLFEIIENTTSEVTFEKVELVFGTPIAIRDVTSCSTNNSCSGASCLFNGVFRGNNNGYSGADPQYPGSTVNGCSWNGSNDNSAWFSFIPTATTARVTISGMLNSTFPTSADMQPIILKGNGNCGIPNTVPTGGCPKDQTINNRAYSNDITINPAPNTGGVSTGSIYFNGISSNCEFNLSGLTVGDKYYLYVDGNAGQSSFFYIEVESGVSTPCDFCCTPITLTGPSSVCSGASPVNFTISGGTGTGTWTVAPASAGSISTTGVFSPASGITSDILAQVTYKEGECSRTADIIVSKCTTFGVYATAPWLTTCSSNSFFNTTGSGADLIDQGEKKDFNDTTLGVFVQNSGTLKLRGAEVKTFKNPSLANVCSARLLYRVVPSGGTPGAFDTIELPFFNDCNTSISEFPSGGPCVVGQQKWQSVRSDAATILRPVDLTTLAPGTYTLQLYYIVTGDENSTTACDDIFTLDNAGRYYNATYTIQATPTLTSTNPTTCNGSEGTITIGGLAPSTTYNITYSDDATTVPAADLTSDASGNIIISGLNSGAYNSFSLVVNGCTIPVSGSVTLTNPVFNPTFPFGNTLSFCPSATVPTLPATSDNGLTGIWNLPVISNTESNSYSFTPNTGQCATNFVLNVTITPLTLNIDKTDNTVCKGTPGGGGTGGCVPKGTGVVINEVKHYPSGAQGMIGTGREYVELYNPTCDPIDISCYVISARSAPNSNPGSTLASGGSIILPQGTIIQPKGHFVVGTSSSASSPDSVDFKTNENTSYYCTTGNFVLANTDGWVGLFDKTGVPVDAIYWTVAAGQGNKISTDDDFDDVPCTPATVSGCSTSGITLLSAAQIFANFPSVINYVGQALIGTGVTSPPTDKTFSRVPDGLDWQRNVDPSIDGNNCNGGTCDTPPPPPPVVGTCNGTAAVNITGGSGSYTYLWKDSLDNTVSTDSIANGLCPGTYKVIVTDAGTNCKDSSTVNILDATKDKTPLFSGYGPFCQGDILTTVILPETSDNGIKGKWSPASLSTDVAGDILYTFTPEAGQCAKDTTITVTVNPRPLVNVVSDTTLCAPATVNLTDPVITVGSTSGLTFAYFTDAAATTVVTDPTSVGDGTYYIVGATTSGCTDTASIKIKINPKPNVLVKDTSICGSATVNLTDPAITAGSTSGLTLSYFSDANATIVLPNTNSVGTGDYYIVGTAETGCTDTAKITVIANPVITPTFTQIPAICTGESFTLPTISNEGITGTWSPAIDNTQTTTYTFTPATGSCAKDTTLTVTVVDKLNLATTIKDTTLYHNAVYPGVIFSGLSAETSVNWINTISSIGLASSGTGGIPAFSAINISPQPVTSNITVKFKKGGCPEESKTFKITVLPLNRDVFIPNVFTPNGDGKNDRLMAYGNYITRIELRIFNQWGELVKVINSPNGTWDGTQNGKAQPVGVYMYTLRATLADGTEINKKGSITLLR
jgi:gliding motility-associated-like protein